MDASTPTTHRGRKGTVVLIAVVAVLAIAIVATVTTRNRVKREGATGSAGVPRMDGSGSIRLDLGAGRALQALLVLSDTDQAQLHLTYYAANGTELAVPSVDVRATSPVGVAQEVAVTKYSAGHYLATGTLAPGEWTFDVDGIRPDGATLSTSFAVDVGSGA